MNKQALLDEIREFQENAHKKEVPEGYITYSDICKEFHCQRQKAQRIVAEMLESGRWERVDIPWNGGKLACFRKLPNSPTTGV